MADQNTQLNVIIQGKDELSPELNRLESKLIRFVGAVSSALAAIKIAAFPIEQAANFQREMANVTKTTNFTAQQIQNLGDQLGQLSLRTDTTAVDLAKIAAAAGQQGLGKDGVEGIRIFTESVARMASVLDLTAADAATSVGKILNIFQIPLKEVERVSSAINQVSNNSTAKATELLNVMKRLGDAGGSLKFTQSLALSATAIDLGATPEVAGTTLSKFITALKVRNDDFAKLLGKTKEQLAQDVKTNAFQVLVDTTQKLSEVRQVDREKAIVKLFGGGRIVALQDKFLIDILKNNSLLNKNLEQALSGESSQTSSKREQATVLATLTKQVEILQNSFKELGRAAGEDLLAPLSGYVAQLRLALQDPGVVSFVGAVARAFGELIATIVNATKFLASLNINWENFLKVGKLLLELKLASIFLGMLTGLPGVSFLIQKITKDSLAMGAAAGAAAGEGVAGVNKQLTAYGALRLSIANAVAAYKAAAAARAGIAAGEADVLAKQAAARAAADRAALLSAAAVTAARQAKVEDNRLKQTVAQYNTVGGTAAATVAATQATGAGSVAAAAAVGQAKMIAAETAHQQQLSLIRAQFAGVRTNAEKATRDGILASEEASYVKRMAALKTHDLKRIAAAEANATAQVAIAEAAAAKQLAIEEAKVIAQAKINAGYAARSAAAAAAASGASTSAQAAAAAAAASQANALNATRVSTLSLALGGLGRVLTIVGVGLRFVLSALGPLYLAFIILTSIADHFGWLEKLPKAFNAVTDAMGFTSEATRKLTQDAKNAEETRKKEKADLDDLLERYGKLKDAKTGLLSTSEIDKLRKNFSNAQSDADVQKGLADLSLPLKGSAAETKKVSEAISNAPDAYKRALADVQNLQGKLTAAQTALDGFRARQQAALQEGTGVVTEMAKNTEKRLTENVAVLTGGIAEATHRAQSFGPSVQAELIKSAPLIGEAGKEINKIMTGIFTPETSKLFDAVVPAILAAKQQIANLEAPVPKGGIDKSNPEIGKLQQAQNDLATATTVEQKKAARERVGEVEAQIEGQKAIVISALNAIRVKLDEFKGDQTLSNIFKVGANNVLSFLNQDLPQLKDFVAQKAVAAATGAKFTGELIAPKQGTEPVANRAFTAGNSGESEAKKAAKARAEFEKAVAAAAQAVQKQANDNRLAEDQRLYERGLIDVRAFYRTKEAVETQNLQTEITLKNQEIAIKQKEINSEGFKESDRIKVRAEIVKLTGDRDVLVAKVQAIPGAMQEALRKEIKTFNETVLTDRLDVFKVLGVTDFDSTLTTQFDLIQSQMSEKLERLRSAIIERVPGITTEFINNFRLAGLLKAIDPVLQSIADKANLTVNKVNAALSRITFLNTTGALTDRQAERAGNDVRAAEADAIAKQIKAAEAVRESALAQIAAKEGATEAEKAATIATLQQTDAYQAQENEIDTLKQKYNELRVVTDSVATSINQSIQSGLEKALNNFTDGTERNLKRIIVGFGTDLAKSINAVIAKDIVQNFVQDNLGGGGTGGIGGFFSQLFNGPTNGGTKEALVAKDLLGRDAGNAMYVRLVDQGFPSAFGDGFNTPATSDPFGPTPDGGNLLDSAKTATATADKAATSIFNSVSGIFSGGNPIQNIVSTGFGFVKKTMFDGISSLTQDSGTGFSGLFSSIGSIFSSSFSGLGNLLGSLGSSLSSLVSSIFGSSGDSGGGLMSGLGSFIGSFFHTGGVVGEGAVTAMMSPLVFANAIRYHSGGIAGLAADEVPSILKKGEEVLTAGDARHRNNGGGGQRVAVSMTINTPDANSFRKSQDQIAAQTGQAVDRAVRRNR